MPHTQNWLQRHVNPILYTVYVTSLLLMLATIACFCVYLLVSLPKVDGVNVAHTPYDREFSISILAFFGTANAMIIIRVYTHNNFVVVLHIFAHLVVFVCLVLNAVYFSEGEIRYFDEVFPIPAFLLIAAYLAQIVTSFLLMIHRPEISPLQQEKHAAIHVYTALITFAIQVWNVLLHVSMLCSSPQHTKDQTIYYLDMLPEPMCMSILILLYTFTIIIILLTPYFETEYRDEIVEMNLEREAKERKKTKVSHYPSEADFNRT